MISIAACILSLAAVLSLPLLAHADISGAVISVSISPENPVEGGSLTGACSANNSSGVTSLQYQWRKDDVANISGSIVFGSSISSGELHTCAIRANDSAVLCWGSNQFGELGDGTTTDHYTPAQINSTDAFTSLSSGSYHSCAIRANDSSILCWGYNVYGQLGDGTTASSYNPVKVNDASNFTRVSTSGGHTCAIRANDSAVLCWGRNENGELGDGTATEHYTPAQINSTSAFASISSGSAFSCAIRANDSRVLCWGDNSKGQLGDGTIADRHNPTPINDTSAFSSISLGDYHACAIRANDSRVLCWGTNEQGQLGDGTAIDAPNPALVNDTSQFTAVSAGNANTCAIRANDSRVLCWGYNSHGQLGDGTTATRLSPALINNSQAFASISAGFYHTCAITASASAVLCWGGNQYGRLGNGGTDWNASMSPIIDTSAFSSISAGVSHACAIRANDSAVLCWGDNQYSQLGDGETSNKYRPAQINSSAAFSLAACGSQHSCAIRANDSAVLCWGDNQYGQLGDGTTSARPSPTPINDTSAFSSISAGSFYTCAIRANDSRVLCWGFNSQGQLGDGTISTRLNPTLINDTSNFTSISAGSGYACAIRANDSAVLCWGANNKGQLGDDTISTRRNPTPIIDTSNFTSISAGNSHTCAIRANDSSILCWGYNVYGQLGDGTTADRHVPTPINDTSNFTSLAAADSFYTCAIRANDSRVLCWGVNIYGQLGDGTATARYNPTPASSASGVTSITDGNFHTCAIRANDSHVLCWGSNEYGQLGFGLNIFPIADPSAYDSFSAGKEYALSTIPVASPSHGSVWTFSCRAATSSDNSSWANSSATVSAPATGNASSINATGAANLTVEINGIANISGTGFGQNATVNISSSEGTILAFNYNFTVSGLDFTAITMENGTDNSKAYTLVSGINSSSLVGTKTLYIYNANPGYTWLCIKDAEVASHSDISASCTGANETLLACDGTPQSGYSCSMNGTTLTVSGLTHSAVIQYSPPAPSSSATGGNSYQSPSLSYAFNCSSGALAITAKSGGEPIRGLEVRLKDPSQAGYLASAATGPQGIAAFAITSSKRYSAETVQASGYFQAYLEPFQLTLCPSSQAQSQGNGTQAPAVAQPAAAPGQKQNESAPLPPAASNGSDGTVPSPAKEAPSPGAAAATAPKAAPDGAAGSLPAQGAATDAVKVAAAPAISLALMGAGIAVVLAAVAGYLFLTRKRK